MKKKLVFLLAITFSFVLASCNKNENVQNQRDRGSRDDSISDIEIPDELIPNKNTSASYLVRHQLENSNGEYETVETEDLKGDIGSLTNALAKTFNGYTFESFE